MNNNLLNEFKNDFYNLVRVEDILAKYGISKSTYFVMIKKLGLKRERSSKMMRTFNINLSSQTDNKPTDLEQKPKISHIPIDDVYKKVDETDNNLVYSRQFVPRGTKLDIEKKEKAVSKPKPVAKKQIEEPKQDDTNNKSELLQAINRSTKVREKILNKKNNNKIE
jgi:hypothetical protein